MTRTELRVDDEVARKALYNLSDKEAALLKFAVEEKSIDAMVRDLEVKFAHNEALSIANLYHSDPAKFLNMLSSGYNRQIIKKNNEQHDPTRPYVGQILCFVGGYNCTLVDFYQVVKVTKAFVTVREIAKDNAENVDGYGQVTYVRPVLNHFTGNPIRRKIQHYSDYSFSINLNNYSSASPWNGNDILEDTLD